jgi:uncharacterized protein (DUF2062 family)
MAEFFKKYFRKWILVERSPQKLAIAFCWGVFVALAPCPGLHTPLLFIISWLLGLNSIMVLSVVYIINNPWTMLPIYAIDYLFGHWLFFVLGGLDLTPYDPAWMEWVNRKIGVYLSRYLGIQKLCLGYFLLGGTILATTIALMLYPFIYRLFIRLARKVEVRDKDENSFAK